VTENIQEGSHDSICCTQTTQLGEECYWPVPLAVGLIEEQRVQVDATVSCFLLADNDDAENELMELEA
jgi:hypothetical protein